MSLLSEIAEQPEVAGRMLDGGRPAIAAVAARLRSRSIRFLVIAARGSSDHAAIYAQYLFGVRHRLPVALAAPSIGSLYGVATRVDEALVIGISQSGASPDVVGVVESARRQGAATLAITNEPGSALAGAAEEVIELGAGQERSIAATKTYSAELLALAILSAELLAEEADGPALAAVPRALEEALLAGPEAERSAGSDAAMTGCIVLGRGFEYATAREWALKLKELTGVVADPYSAADFQHGPIALVGEGFPILAVAPSGAAAPDLVALLRRLREEQGARILVLSDSRETRAVGHASLPLPTGVPEWLRPVVSIVPAQLYAYHLARARGLDPEAPRYLRKVTLTR